jgi:hypothetical protein
VTSTGEESRKDFLGHVEYRYFCKGLERSDPTYKASASAACGVDSGPQPVLADSENVSLESGGTTDNNSDVCNTHQTQVCVRPNTAGGKLVPGSGKFKVGRRSGRVFVDGNPANNNPIGTSNIGWFINPDDNSPDKICATVYARTSACETRVSIEGKLTAQEIPPAR